MARSNHRARHHHKKKIMTVTSKAKPLLVDRLTYMAAIIEPLATLPQVWRIYSTKTAAGISLSSWIVYCCFSLIWVWYGIVHKEKTIIVYQGLFATFEIMVIIGGLLYGAGW